MSRTSASSIASDGSVALTWRRTGGAGRATLNVRPLLSGRDYHALMHENAAFDFSARAAGGNVTWRPYPNVPAIAALSNGALRARADLVPQLSLPRRSGTRS